MHGGRPSYHVTPSSHPGSPANLCSALGARQGRRAPGGRGRLVDATVAAIDARKPLCFILEHAAGFANIEGGRVRNHVVNRLHKLRSYELYERLINTSTFGVPLTRKRWSLVGLLWTAVVRAFDWLDSIDMIPLVSLLGPTSGRRCYRRRPPKSQRRAREAVDCTKLVNAHLVLDCGASSGWSGKPRPVSP